MHFFEKSILYWHNWRETAKFHVCKFHVYIFHEYISSMYISCIYLHPEVTFLTNWNTPGEFWEVWQGRKNWQRSWAVKECWSEWMGSDCAAGQRDGVLLGLWMFTACLCFGINLAKKVFFKLVWLLCALIVACWNLWVSLQIGLGGWWDLKNTLVSFEMRKEGKTYRWSRGLMK